MKKRGKVTAGSPGPAQGTSLSKPDLNQQSATSLQEEVINSGHALRKGAAHGGTKYEKESKME
jgi:hypothetical protein